MTKYLVSSMIQKLIVVVSIESNERFAEVAISVPAIGCESVFEFKKDAEVWAAFNHNEKENQEQEVVTMSPKGDIIVVTIDKAVSVYSLQDDYWQELEE